MATKKTKKAKPEKPPKAPNAERVLGYFQADSTVGAIARMVSDGKVHKIDPLLADVQKERGVDAEAALFAFKTVFTSKYPGKRIGKLQHKKLGHATVNFAEGTVQFHAGSGDTKIIPAAKAEKNVPASNFRGGVMGSIPSANAVSPPV